MPLFTVSNGLTITAESEAAANAVDAFTDNLLGLRQALDLIPDQADQFPETPMVQACAATYFIYAQETAMLTKADVFLEKAEAGLATLTERETMFIQAMRLFQRNRFHEALGVLELLTTRWPEDLLAAKVAEFLYYCIGQHYSGLRFLEHMERLEKHHPAHAGYWSMRSFATELCGDYALAQLQAEKSLTLDAEQPWAHHTLAHVLSRTGREGSERQAMERCLPLWRKSNRGIHSHNAWHLGLLYLDALDMAKVHTLIQEDLWGITPDAVFEQLDTTALLWRMDLCGESTADSLWSQVADHAEAHAGQCIIPFLEGHYAYALARAGRVDAVNAMVQKAIRRAEADDLEAREVWAPIGVRLVQACAAFGAGRQKEGVDWLEPVADFIPRVGGSDAQDDLFRQALIAGLVAAGRPSEAQGAWKSYYGTKPLTDYDRRIIG